MQAGGWLGQVIKIYGHSSVASSWQPKAQSLQRSQQGKTEIAELPKSEKKEVLEYTLLKLKIWKQLLHDMLISDEHKKELKLLEIVLSDEQLNEKLLLLMLYLLLVELQLRERLLKLQLSSLETG